MVAARSTSTRHAVDQLPTLPADAGEIALDCADLLGMPAIAGSIRGMLEGIAAIPHVEAIGVAVWTDGPTVPFLTLYPVMDLRRLGEDGDPINSSSTRIDEIFDRFLLDHWGTRRTFRSTMLYVNSRGQRLSAVVDEVFADLERSDPLHGSERGTGATVTHVVAEVAA